MGSALPHVITDPTVVGGHVENSAFVFLYCEEI